MLLHCVVIESYDGTVSVNGPYEIEASARLAAYAIAEHEAQEGDTIYKHDKNGSTVGDEDAGQDTMSVYVVPMGTALDI